MRIEAFFDPRTYTLTYLVWDEASKDAVVIDPVLDYEPVGSYTFTESADKVSAMIREHGLKLHYILETHAHADHISGSQLLKARHGAKVVIGHRIREVQATFKHLFDLPNLATDGSQFDLLVKEGDVLKAGTLAVEVIETPGHTPACVTYKIEDAIFTGDALFMDDYGVGRCDFPKGDAATLYDSVMKLYRLPDETRVFPGHDYLPNGRPVRWQTTIGASKANNPHIRMGITKEEFVRFRTARDKELAAPRLLYQSVQVNVDGGRLPEKHGNGIAYFNLPVNLNRKVDRTGAPLSD
ncbi:MAG: MBL fold metallo-hydrolase [Deltaproteobacteria bacterium]|nr:MBL fold metallo-hydrolase [Sandaracinaceae bacterium]MCX7808175.1 MBL fold metallo-hydrolase [Deltaproteobacteria bacterium]MDW8246495.1 MBL fold metallo-hydrolase [Sandaracinaceae bacterium]